MNRFTLSVIALGALGVGALVAWLVTGDAFSIKDDLRFIMPRSLEWTFLLMVAGFAVNFRGIRESLPAKRFLPLCADVLGNYQTQVLMEESAGFFRFVLYRLLPPREPPPLG